MTGLQKTLALLKKHEGFSDTVYLDGKGIPTIGYGFTDPGLIKKGKITRKEADAILTKRIASEYKALHDTLPNFDKLSDDSKSALISYRFNYPAGFKDTTKFMNYWRAGQYDKAIKEVDAGMNDAANPGLRARRLEEQALLSSDPFLTGIKTTNGDFGKKMVFPIEKQPEYEPEWKLQQPTKTVYPLNNTVPESISSWSGADAPNATPRVKDFQEATRDDAYQQWLNQGINVTSRRSPFKLSLSLPSLDSMMQIESPQRLMENYFAEVLGINNMIPSIPSLFPRFKNGKLPCYEDGSIPGLGTKKNIKPKELKLDGKAEPGLETIGPMEKALLAWIGGRAITSGLSMYNRNRAFNQQKELYKRMRESNEQTRDASRAWKIQDADKAARNSIYSGSDNPLGWLYDTLLRPAINTYDKLNQSPLGIILP